MCPPTWPRCRAPRWIEALPSSLRWRRPGGVARSRDGTGDQRRRDRIAPDVDAAAANDRAGDRSRGGNPHIAAAKDGDGDILLGVDVHALTAHHHARDIAPGFELDVAADDPGTGGVDVLAGGEIDVIVARIRPVDRDLDNAAEAGVNAPLGGVD